MLAMICSAGAGTTCLRSTCGAWARRCGSSRRASRRSRTPQIPATSKTDGPRSSTQNYTHDPSTISSVYVQNLHCHDPIRTLYSTYVATHFLPLFRATNYSPSVRTDSFHTKCRRALRRRRTPCAMSRDRRDPRAAAEHRVSRDDLIIVYSPPIDIPPRHLIILSYSGLACALRILFSRSFFCDFFS